MKHIERTTLTTATTPGLWLRYVDDTLIMQEEEHKENFLDYITKVDPSIKSTVENNHQDVAIPFLDTIVKLQPYPLLYMENLCTQTSTFNGIATII